MDDQHGGLVDTLQTVSSFLARDFGLFIDGKNQMEAHASYLDIINPADGTVIAKTVNADEAGVDAAVTSARKSFDTKVWRGLRPADRERILLKFADLIEMHSEELAQLETLNQGKSINLSRMVDVGATIEYMRYIAGLATKISGETLDVSIPIPPGTHYTAYTQKEPVGVVAAIAPWNFPMMIGMWKIMPALAAGCSIVLKPSELTPLTSLRIAELALEAGVPAGVLNVITGDGNTGRALVSHAGVNKITFTGSTETGKAIGKAAVENMTRVSLELGGKNPAVFFSDIDLEAAVGGAIMGGLMNQGQVCAASSRLYVHRSIYGDFTDALSAAVAGLPVGAGMNPEAMVNPLVSEMHRTKVVDFINRGVTDGAQVTAGGHALDQDGFYVAPTIMRDVDHTMHVAQVEGFGPVMTVTPFDTDDQALSLVNDSPFGLAASIWTNDLSRTMKMVPEIQAGTVWVNSHVPLDPNMPFGGYKQSGIGRDFGIRSLDGYLETKSVCIGVP